MKTLHFSTAIDAPRELVWDAMLGPDTYRLWTAPFCEGSYYEGSWAKDAKIRFLGPGGGEGMSSVIDENRLYEFISIRHLGEIKDGIEDTESERAKSWAQAFENYTFTSKGKSTEVKVDIDTAPDFEGYMNEAWPKALAALKSLCEAQAKA